MLNTRRGASLLVWLLIEACSDPPHQSPLPVPTPPDSGTEETTSPPPSPDVPTYATPPDDPSDPPIPSANPCPDGCKTFKPKQ